MSGGNAATTTISSGAIASISVPTGTLSLGRTLSIQGATTFNGVGTIGPSGGNGTIVNAAAFTISGDSTISVPVTNTATGVITKSSTGTTILSGSLTNAGAVHVDAGTLQLTGTSGSASGSLAIALNAQVTHAGGAFTYGPTAVLSGEGDIRFTGSLATFADGMTFGLDGFFVSAGSLTLNGDLTVNFVSQNGGTITGPGDLTLLLSLGMSGNSIVMSGGNAATTTISSGAIASISVPTGTLSLGRTLSIQGATTFNGVGTIGPSGGNGTIVNAAAFTISGDSTISVPVTNTATGVITKSSTGTTILSGSLTNAGAVHVDAGTLQLTGTSGSASGSLAIALNAQVTHAGGAFTYGPTAVLSGEGDIRFTGSLATFADGMTFGLDGFFVSAGSLTLNGDLTVNFVSQNGGTITGPGDLTLLLSLGMSGNSIVMSGGNAATTTISSGAIASISVPTGTLSLGRTLSIQGATTFNGVGTIGPSGGNGTIVNAAAFTISGDSTISVPVTNTATGVITKSSTGTTILSGSLTNAGAVHVDAGTLQLTGTSGSASGSLAIALNAQVTHAGGAFTYGPTAVLSGEGDIRFTGSLATFADGMTFGLDGFFVSAGSLTLNGDLTVNFVSQNGGTITGPGDLTLLLSLGMSGNSIVMSGGNAATTTISSGAIASISVPTGTLSLGRTLSIQGATTFNGVGTIGPSGGNGTIVNAAAFTISGDSTISVPVTNTATGVITKSSTGTTILSGTFTNSGVLSVSAGIIAISGSFTNYVQPTDVLTGGTYRLTGTLRFTGADIVSNNGALIELNGPASAVVDTVGNDGFRNFTANGGMLSIRDGRTLTLPKALTNTGVLLVASASTLVAPSVNNSTGTLSGTGTVVATVTSAGDVLPGTTPGILTITGPYTQSAAGTLEIEIGGIDPGSGHDRLDISDAATIDGTLVLSTTGGFAPSNRRDIHDHDLRVPHWLLLVGPGARPRLPRPGTVPHGRLRPDERRRDGEAGRVHGR